MEALPRPSPDHPHQNPNRLPPSPPIYSPSPSRCPPRIQLSISTMISSRSTLASGPSNHSCNTECASSHFDQILTASCSFLGFSTSRTYPSADAAAQLLARTAQRTFSNYIVMYSLLSHFSFLFFPGGRVWAIRVTGPPLGRLSGPRGEYPVTPIRSTALEGWAWAGKSRQKTLGLVPPLLFFAHPVSSSMGPDTATAS